MTPEPHDERLIADVKRLLRMHPGRTVHIDCYSAAEADMLCSMLTAEERARMSFSWCIWPEAVCPDHVVSGGCRG